MRGPGQDEALRSVRPEHANLRAAIDWMRRSRRRHGCAANGQRRAAPRRGRTPGADRGAALRAPRCPSGGAGARAARRLEPPDGAGLGRRVPGGCRERRRSRSRRRRCQPRRRGPGSSRSTPRGPSVTWSESIASATSCSSSSRPWALASARRTSPGSLRCERTPPLGRRSSRSLRATSSGASAPSSAWLTPLEGRALILVRADRPGEAAPFAEESLRLFARSGNAGCTAHSLEAVAACLAAVGAVREMAELSGAAEAFREATGQGHRPWELRGAEETLAALSAGDAEVDATRARGRTHSLASAVDRALSFLASVEARRIDADRP